MRIARDAKIMAPKSSNLRPTLSSIVDQISERFGLFDFALLLDFAIAIHPMAGL
jgi:hypothetical protein